MPLKTKLDPIDHQAVPAESGSSRTRWLGVPWPRRRSKLNLDRGVTRLDPIEQSHAADGTIQSRSNVAYESGSSEAPTALRSHQAENVSPGGTASDAVPIVLITDPGADLDDEVRRPLRTPRDARATLPHLCRHLTRYHESCKPSQMAMILICNLESLGLVRMCCAVANLQPAFDRARLTRGTLDVLGMFDCPVGIGTDGGEGGAHYNDTFSETGESYMPPSHSLRAHALQPGRKLLHTVFSEAASHSLTVVLISSLKDIALFLRDNEQLFVDKCAEVVIMGGVRSGKSAGGFLVPDTAHNNEFDKGAADFFYFRCQQVRINNVSTFEYANYIAPSTEYLP